MRGDAEAVLRDLSVRGDIIKTMHRALTRDGGRFDPSALALHDEVPTDPVTGRLVDRGLHYELAGSAYAIVDGADGRTPQLRFGDMELTGDARPQTGSASCRAGGCQYGYNSVGAVSLKTNKTQ